MVKDFGFKSGERLAEIKIHYATFGTLRRDTGGKPANAVLLLHSTGGSLRQYLTPNFAGVLFGAGQLLDAQKYFIIVPDNIGHGQSSKPSDGLHMRFPQYGYDDMIELQYRLVTQELHVSHLRLVMGASMGGMHTWLWGEQHPDMMDAPAAAGEPADRNRRAEPACGEAHADRHDPQRSAVGKWRVQDAAFSSLRVGDRVAVNSWGPTLDAAQKDMPTREKADAYLEDQVAARLKTTDANDLLYYVDASRDYSPEAELERITAPLTAINSADDAINPAELKTLDRDIARVKNGKYVLIPGSAETRGHGTHSYPVFWQEHLAALLERSEKR